MCLQPDHCRCDVTAFPDTIVHCCSQQEKTDLINLRPKLKSTEFSLVEFFSSSPSSCRGLFTPTHILFDRHSPTQCSRGLSSRTRTCTPIHTVNKSPTVVPSAARHGEIRLLQLLTKSSADDAKQKHTRVCVCVCVCRMCSRRRVLCCEDDSFSAPRILGVVGDSVMGKHPLSGTMGERANVMSIYCET